MSHDHPAPTFNSADELTQILAELCSSVRSFSPEGKIYVPPVLDRNESEHYFQEHLPGLTKFVQSCEKEASWVAKLSSASKGAADVVSSNAPFLYALWQEVKAAKLPLVGINAQYHAKNRDMVKVDVVADNGNEWIKVNTIRLTPLLREFRELDSEINSDSYSSGPEEFVQLSKYPISPVNSITKQCYDLVQAAQQHQLKTGAHPRIVYRLTRMEPEEDGDERVQATYECIRKLGVDLRFGPTASSTPQATAATKVRPTLLPTTKLNLDLSLLIALISDISHSTLPATEEGADERFKPIERTWKRKVDPETKKVSAVQLEAGELGPEEHFRALAIQLKQEMEYSLVDDLDDQIGAACKVNGVDYADVEFWTTSEAKERCEKIVGLIGGTQEKRRAQAIFEQESDFWYGSRHVNKQGPLSRLWVRILPEEETDSSAESTNITTFPSALALTCRKLLAQEDYQQLVPLELVGQEAPDLSRSAAAKNEDSDQKVTAAAPPPRPRPGKKGKKLGAATCLRIPTAHTVRSMLEGANRGMTTITANRLSVKQMVRAVGSTEGLTDSVAEQEAVLMVVEPKTLAELKRSDTVVGEEPGGGGGAAAGPVQTIAGINAAIWTMEPRSLAETMRNDWNAEQVS